MLKKVIVRGPALTQSGYGEHTRFLLRSLAKFPEKYDVYLVSVNWGQTGWLHEDNDERRWLDDLVKKTHAYTSASGQFDMSIQVTIPNEWDKLAPYNVGVTAGIETTKVAPVWLEKANLMDKIVTISEHSKQVFEMTAYQGFHKETKQPVTLACQTPIEVVHYPIKECEPSGIELELDFDFNYLVIAQWGPRKNLENTIKWWVEENYDEKVGLIVKTSVKNNSIMDREHLHGRLTKLVRSISVPDMKCKIYLLHGDLSEEEMQSLYVHPKIKCLASLTHGEGFGLPLFDAASRGLPIIAPGWSGHCDFLYIENDKGKKKSMFADVNYNLSPVKREAVWEGVLQADSLWCYPHEGHYKMRLRQMRKSHKKWLDKAKKLQKWILKNFEAEGQYTKFAEAVSCGKIDDEEINEMFDKLMSNMN